ncbi:MAG: HAMP domain-containing sensor histidine kinase [Bacteroidota bacterium]
MNIYRRKQIWKTILLVTALMIGIASLWYTNKLVRKLSNEERKEMELWAKAEKELGNTNDPIGDIAFLWEVIRTNTTIPVILTDEKDNVLNFRNLDSTKANKPEYLKEQLELMTKENNRIVIEIGNGRKNYIYYKDSILLTQLKYYPMFQLGVIALFLFVSYLAFSSSRKAEQNQVWIGMSKETAHQLGTPLSSLLAWLELMKMRGMDPEMIVEIEKDVSRLQTITERFSKVGAAPVLVKENLNEVIKRIFDYIKSRTSEKVSFYISSPQKDAIYADINAPLFEWVLENLLKNAVDAMNGSGSITISIMDQQQFVYVDVTDTGKGIQKGKFKTIFKPGYTTKSRGWGLGLSLAKRIIEEYHSGQIFVKSSDINKGTTFRIVLKKIV